MLRSLSIRDFVIVASLDLDFSSGFTALTGETGAGKSILIDALEKSRSREATMTKSRILSDLSIQRTLAICLRSEEHTSELQSL